MHTDNKTNKNKTNKKTKKTAAIRYNRHKTTKLWFSHLLRHLVRKRSGPILITLEPNSKSHPPSKNVLKLTLALPGGALTNFPFKLRLNFSLRPGGAGATTAPPVYVCGHDMSVQ